MVTEKDLVELRSKTSYLTVVHARHPYTGVPVDLPVTNKTTEEPTLDDKLKYVESMAVYSET